MNALNNTITKRADELKVCDVVRFATTRYVVLALGKHPGMVYLAPLDEGTLMWRDFQPDREIEVEVFAPVLTPAQQHAEELLRLVRSMAGVLKYKHTMSDHDFDEHSKAHVADTHEVLAKIDPPAPPTLEEALAALAQAAEGLDEFDSPERYKQAHGVLDRARRAGVLNEPGATIAKLSSSKWRENIVGFGMIEGQKEVVQAIKQLIDGVAKRDMAIAEAVARATYNASHSGPRKAFCDLGLDLAAIIAKVPA